MEKQLFGHTTGEPIEQHPPSWEPAQATDGHHATPSLAALAGGLTGGLIGVFGGPVGVAAGTMGGALVGLFTERLLHGGGGDEPHGGRAWTAEYDQDDIRTRARERVLERERGVQEGSRTERRQEEPAPRLLPGEDGQLEVRKEVETERRSVDIPIARQGVVVERRPMPRLPSEQPAGVERMLRVQIQREEVVLEKRATVREVISMAKRQTPTLKRGSTAERDERPGDGRREGEERDESRATPLSGGSPPA